MANGWALLEDGNTNSLVLKANLGRWKGPCHIEPGMVKYKNGYHSSCCWFCHSACQRQEAALISKLVNTLCFSQRLTSPPNNRHKTAWPRNHKQKMCQVRCRYYKCGHSFHELVKRCPEFNQVLDDARKNSDLETYRCENHGSKIDRCKGVKPVNGKFDEESMLIRINDIDGPWSVARRNIVGAHCETPDFLGGGDRPVNHPRLEGKCGECAEKEPEPKGWFGFWK